MKRKEFEFLKNIDYEEYLDKDPIKLLFQGVSTEICNHIRTLQKAKEKLPDYYNVRAIIPSISFEQSSSILTAIAKDYSGESLLDLTCGLGVDSYIFSKSFKKVTTIERDELLCDIARYNFSKLGASNIEVVCSDSVEYLDRCEREYDLIFIDPARRGSEGERVFLFEDCSPNIFEVIKRAKSITKKLVIKASPLFDVLEANRLFSRYGNVNIECVSLGNECKELLIEIAFNEECSITHSITTISKGGDIYRYKSDITDGEAIIDTLRDSDKYIYIGDVALYKSRLFHHYTAQFKDTTISSKEGVLFANDKLDHFCGKGYEIIARLPKGSKEQKKLFKQMGISALSTLKRGDKNISKDFLKKIGLKEGGTHFLIKIGDQLLLLSLISN